MAVIKMKPTSPGQRGVVKVTREHLHKGAPHAALLEPQIQKAGRNNNGHITTRHKGGGHKHHYRVVDFRRMKDGIPAKVEHIEYDPNRSAHLALLCYADGERTYIIAPRGVEAGATLMSGAEAPIRAGNCLPIRNIPVGSTIHCVELQIGKGAQMIRSAGTSATFSGTAFAAAVRVIHWVHCYTTHGWANTHPALDASLTQTAQAVLFVGYFAQRCTALNVHLAHFARAQAHLCVYALASQQGSRCTG